MIALDQRRLRPIPQPRPSFLLGNMLDVRAETRLQDLTRALTVVRELGGLPGPLQKLRVVKQQEVQGAIDRMNAVIDQIIADRKQKMQDATPKSDLLNAMLTGVDKQTGEGLSDENIRYQMITFLIAGHETTSSLLSWAIYFLLKNPEALARASEEVDRVLGRDYGAHPTFKQVQQLDYVAQVLKETLRLAAPSQAAAPTQVAQHHTPLLVLYGSNMGTSEAGAHYLGGDAEAKGFVATVVPLDDYVGKLPTEGAVVILTSSYNGGPPDNAVKFCDWLERGGLGADSLRGVNYTIFGCGNRDWASTYQRIPRLIDAKLESYGARRIYSHGEGDASEDLLNAFEDWYKPFWKNVAQALSLDVALPETADRKVLYDVEVVEEHPWHPLAAEFGAQTMRILEDRELHRKDGAYPSERSTRHLELELPAGITYRAGDHLGILPHNGEALVRRVTERFDLDEDATIRLHATAGGTTILPLNTPIRVGDLLSDYVGLQEVATRKQIGVLAEHTQCPPEKEKLLALSGDDEASRARCRQEILERRKSVIDLLEEYPSCQLPFNAYLSMLTRLSPRYYSISSSPRVEDKQCSVTVGVVEALALSGRGIYRGTCSCYLAGQVPGGSVLGFVKDTKSNFRLPEDPRTPIIMVGPGTGLAPFRGFLQERAAQQKANGAPIGKSLLFFGCRHPDLDYIYHQELEEFARQGVTELDVAFSRQEGQPKSYVRRAPTTW